MVKLLVRPMALRYSQCMTGRINKRAAASTLAVLVFALVPAAALAEPGSDQYCDPFGGCGNSGQTGGGNSNKGGSGKHLTSKQIEGIINNLESKSFSAKQRAAALAGADAATVAKYQEALKARQAAKVLEAAGLSALGPTVSHR